jgi:hypothetical protein
MYKVAATDISGAIIWLHPPSEHDLVLGLIIAVVPSCTLPLLVTSAIPCPAEPAR